MALFDYTGQLQSGALFQGTLEADSQEHAEATLTDMGLRVTALRRAQRTAYVAPLSVDDMLFLNEQLAAMAKSAIPLEEGLRHLAADVGSRKLKRLLLDLSDELASGTPLEQAIEKHRRRFPVQYAEVIKAGLASGDLGGTLYGVTAHLRLKSQFRRVLIELATYPIFVLAFALLVLSFLMRHLIPELASVMRDFSTNLPRALEWLFAVARNWALVEAGIVAAVVVIVMLFAATYLPRGQSVREWVLRRVPGFAQVYWSSVLARFTHTSALAAYSGTPLPELVAASGAASGSLALARATRRVAERIQQGQGLDAAAQGEDDLPALWRCVVATASGRGELPAALEELADVYEQRARQWISTVRMVLGPLLLLIVGVALGGMVVLVFSVLAGLIRSTV